MLKKFDKFANEKLNSELDPYGEERDEDDVFEEFDINDDLSVEDVWVETTYTYNVKLGKYKLKYKLVYDDDGFSSLDRVEENDEKLPEHVLDFCEEYDEEIKEILVAERYGR